MSKQKEALKLLEGVLAELESSKSSVSAAIQKLSRASGMIDEVDIYIWCAIQLGERQYVDPLQKLLDLIRARGSAADSKIKEELQAKIDKQCLLLDKIGLNSVHHYNSAELTIKNDKAGGGYSSIDFVEERYASIARGKRGNDGTHYQQHLKKYISHVSRVAHRYASELFNRLKFTDATSTSFDILKIAVDDKLLDINAELAEQLMQAFKSISSGSPEEWSQALTTCRRFLEGLANELYPPREESINGRMLGAGQYVNRLWFFMDEAIKSDSNRDLAKKHIDFLGSLMQGVYKLSNKGVHAQVERIEAVKAVFHTYLVVADILEYLDRGVSIVAKSFDLNTATLDELEAILDVKRNIAKEIIKYRVEHGGIDVNDLSRITGIGPATFKKIQAKLKV